jgi:hypothetical protein
MFEPEKEILESLEYAAEHIDSIGEPFLESLEALGNTLKFGPGPVMDKLIEMSDSGIIQEAVLGIRGLGLICGPLDKVFKVLESKKVHRSVRVSTAARESLLRLLPIKMVEEMKARQASGILNPHAVPNVLPRK